jgi:hypothetical protein
MTSPPKNNALGDPAAEDLQFLENFDEFNTAWPDYQVRCSLVPSRRDRLRPPLHTALASYLQDFQSTAEDAFGGSFLDGGSLGRLPAGMVSPSGHKTPVSAALASSTWR